MTANHDTEFERQWELHWRMEQATRLVRGQITRFASQARFEKTVVSYYFDLDDDDVPVYESSWILYCIKNGEFIENVRYLEANHRGAVVEGFPVRGRSMYKEKLHRRLRQLAPLHDFIKHATCLHREPWKKPFYLPSHVQGSDHSDYTIVMHPWLVNHMRVYNLGTRDVIEGMMFGDRERYIAASSHALWNYPRVPRQREYVDYRTTHEKEYSEYLSMVSMDDYVDRGANIGIPGERWHTD